MEEKKVVNKTSKSDVEKNTTQNVKIIKNQIKENKIQKLENLANQNIATVINSLDNKNIEPIKKSWFVRFLEFIF